MPDQERLPAPVRTEPVVRTIGGSDRLPLVIQEMDGPPGSPIVLLVHGYPDDHHVWDLVIPMLTEHHRVVTHDVRGAGDSAAPRNRLGYRLGHLAADIDAVARSVSPDAPVHLVGHDWGSIQAWSAILDPSISPRIASFTSMSGPPLEHVARWIAARRRPGEDRWRQLARQAVGSWYIYAFHTPIAPTVWRFGLAHRWPSLLRRRESVRIDDGWPGPRLGRNARNGIELYRANMLPTLGRSHEVRTDVPVQLLVARRDPFVTPALLDGLEEIAPDLVRVELDVGHWVPRSHPAEVAAAIAEHVARTTPPTDHRSADASDAS